MKLASSPQTKYLYLDLVDLAGKYRSTRIVALVLFLAWFSFSQPCFGQWTFSRGDCNGNNAFQIDDAIFLLMTLFRVGGPVGCEDACDSNDDGILEIGDSVYKLFALFAESFPPPFPPHPECGSDLTPDALECVGPLDGCPPEVPPTTVLLEPPLPPPAYACGGMTQIDPPHA